MPRRNRPPKRVIEPDVKYNSELVARFESKDKPDSEKVTGEIEKALAAE